MKLLALLTACLALTGCGTYVQIGYDGVTVGVRFPDAPAPSPSLESAPKNPVLPQP